jgi:hypothetical protein
MVVYTFSKLYTIVLDVMLSKLLEHENHKARGLVGFKRDLQIIDHFFTL